MWRSLVAYMSGGHGVAGSNPVISTNEKELNRDYGSALFVLLSANNFDKTVFILIKFTKGKRTINSQKIVLVNEVGLT